MRRLSLLTLTLLFLTPLMSHGNVVIVNYSSYQIHGSEILYSYSNSSYLIQEKLTPINITSVNYILQISYFPNWTLDISTNLPNIFSIFVGNYLIWSGFETNGLTASFLIPYMNPLNLTIWVMNYPNPIPLNTIIPMGEEVVLHNGEISNLYIFKTEILKTIKLNTTLPSFFSYPSYYILTYNYTYAPVTVFNSSEGQIDIIRGINGITVLEVGLVHFNNLTFYVYNISNQRVYPAVEIVKNLVITTKGVETPFIALSSLIEDNLSLVIVNSTAALIIVNKSITYMPIHDVTIEEPSFIFMQGKFFLGYSIFVNNPGIYRFSGHYNLFNAPYVTTKGSTYFITFDKGYYFALPRSLSLSINPIPFLFAAIISSLLTILILLINKIFR
ncbi:hypothetical protein SULI_04680 [Saccharolobus solfataricus]|uniref:Thermopsin n=3 Tax=Saccharolobus solfataricus TaxID=2287 RepID=Q97U42_SACS2|nr:hypothetical protein [Saccharolobus solfataricus]AAK43280.1 Hypothetical protein SSO3181 [Saccharolobus solfataricus P2]AKA73303.1 hypothetical protein SULB_0956 [Saccharolobus solfataricus]AKA76002.1 hypothetical protein SULC_0955 [Saccharolobus solfataricus]AKA78695.1 hypothetical protein SULA_0954 [Saccharolobus solfataricus]AZF67770.1 hypothetical protein SULG_04680 [Saccharolobus solfataricus]